MSTAPARTVSRFKRTLLLWSVEALLCLWIPIIFAACVFGIGVYAGATLLECLIATGIAGIIAMCEGNGYMRRMIRPMFFDIAIIICWPVLRKPLLQYVGLLAIVPLVTFVACPIADRFASFPTSWAAAGTALLSLLIVHVILGEMDASFIWKFVRGRIMLTEDEVDKRIDLLSKGRETPESSYRAWGGREIPEELMGPHSQVVGMTRSGKSVTMTLWLQSLMPHLYPGSNSRAVVFDAKAELLPTILGMEPPCPVISLCPLHECGYAWDFAADVMTPSEARMFAAMLIPEEGETQKYFPRSAQRILEGVVRILIDRSPGRWDLQDILMIFRDLELLRKMLESHETTRDLVAKYFEPETTWKNTLSTLDVSISRFETVAACWRHAANEGRAITLSDFLASSSVLVISRIQDLRDALDPMNRLIFQRLFELMLAGPEAKLLPKDEQPRTYVLLDEIAKAGKIDLLDDIMLQGAGKGIRVFLAYQSILSMREEYGDKQADALVGQCSNTAIYRIKPETAEWAARWFGEHEVLEDLQASSGNLVPDNHRPHLQRSKLQTLLPSQFMTLPFPQETQRISGYYLTDGIGAYEVSFPFIDQLPEPVNLPIIPRRPASQQRLPYTFSAQDIERLQLGAFLSQNGQVQTQPHRSLNHPQASHEQPDSVRFLRNFRNQSRD